MNLTYNLSLEDMLEFQDYCGKHIPTARKGRFNLRVIPALIPIAIAVMLTVNDSNFIYFGMFIIVIAVLYMVFFPVIYRQLFAYSFRQLKRNNPEDVDFVLGEGGISVSSSSGKTELFWSTIKDIIVTRGLILFFYTPVCAIIVPKRSFDNDSDLTGFLHLARQYQSENSNT